MNKSATLPRSKRPWLTMIILLVIVFAAGAGVMKYIQSTSEHGATDVNLPPGSPQPPGPAPEGKKWNVEHGHWHNIVTDKKPVIPSTAKTGPATPQKVPTPQPPGPVPEGKVWNEDHGHWHNKITKTEPVTITTGPDEAEETNEVDEAGADDAIDVELTNDVPTDFEEVSDEAPVEE